ncbi:MAG: DNA translocase FtsK 4TM domain-containing protein, partial [Burkholderiaceae bacterium]
MTYSLDTLTSGRRSPRASTPTAPTTTGFGKFAAELALLAGVLLLAFWLLALLSYSHTDAAWSTSGNGGLTLNRAGRLGAWIADASYYLFGFSVWWLMAIGVRTWLAGLATWLRQDSPPQAPRDGSPISPAWLTGRVAFWCGLVLLLSASCVLEWTRLYSFDARLPGDSGGALGSLLGPFVLRWLGFTGSGLVAILLGLAGSALAFRFSWGNVAERIGAAVHTRLESSRKKREAVHDIAMGQQAAREREVVVTGERVEIKEHHPAPVHIEPVVLEVPKSDRVAKERQKPLFADMLDSKLPQVDLLDAAQARQETVSPEMLDMTSRMIEKKLKDFGVEVWVILALPGPVITRYEIEPALGVKGSQIVGLAKDLARSLSLTSIRVVETIPGKNYMALELPNAKRQSIRLSEILGSRVYNEAKSMLTIGLGKDIVGNPVVADLAKMPHVLVAGTTGSGKSVGINAMILSLLYKADARDVRLLMIDPKMLEMSVYEGIPHLLAPVVTDMRQAAHGLNWCVAEMERRYKLMSKMGVRNLAGYNVKLDEAKASGEFIYNPFSLTPEQPEPLERLPY